MAKKDKSRDRRLKTAVRKVPKKAVSISTGNVMDDASKLIATNAMHVVSGLPAHIKRQYCEGVAEFDKERREAGGPYTYRIWVSRGGSDSAPRVHSHHVTESELTNPDKLARIGRALGRRIADDIRAAEHIRTPPPRKPPKSDADEFDKRIRGFVAVEAEKKKKGVGKLGPVCPICGPEDRDAFPEWGGCPHIGAEDDS